MDDQLHEIVVVFVQFRVIARFCEKSLLLFQETLR